MRRVRRHLFTSHAASPPKINFLLWSFSIDSLWVISKLMACARRAEERTFGRRYPDKQRDGRWVVCRARPRGRRQNKVINNLPKRAHKRPQSRSSHPWLYSKVPIMLRQKTTVRGWHSAIKQIISSWRNRRKKTLIWGVEDGVRRISVKGSG